MPTSPQTPRPRGALHLPFAEQIEYIRNKKTDQFALNWDDITGAAHNRSFVVAGAMKGDLLKDLHDAVTKAIEQGTTLEKFREDFLSIVDKHGWTGWTGEGTEEGEAWRARIIYETNLRASYAAGRRAQLTDPDFLKARPFWKYVHSDLVFEPRAQHLAWDGICLPHDHPFWQTHFAPNGFGCCCRIIAVGEPGKGDITTPPEGWNEIDPATGEQKGIGKGWGYAPGASEEEELRWIVEQKVAKLPERIARDFQADVTQAGILATTTPPPPPPPTSLDEFISAGKKITDTLPAEPTEMLDALRLRLDNEVGTGRACAIVNGGKGAKSVQEASVLYPKSWVAEADGYGPLHAKLKSGARGYHWSADHQDYPVGSKVKLPDYGVVTVEQNVGYMVVEGKLGNAVHEYAHRLQAALPQLQGKFAELHLRRTQGDALESLKTLQPDRNYRANEMVRKDKYINPYWGKEYSGDPREVMTMAMETVLGGEDLSRLYNEDREMFDFVVGLLFHWKP
jgi:hypothetical protein